MEKQIFKAGDRVFIYGLGWVVIEKVAELYVVVCKTYSEKDSFFTIPNDLVSFTEYTLQGNSQERPINYEDYIEKWGKFKSRCGFFIDKLEGFGSYGKDSNKHFFIAKGANKEIYEFEPLTKEQIKVLGLE
ncbi:hypothetical protein [Capnocytophaga canis]|uniref:Uncharacterized protein n=1 Tax=Capnocytophaga canis TaxID=1848903 RepID=A0A0B7IPU5_9FLAO|nr:hypothetical protein [Capnocytophaga canis]CEN53911.1 hypothetical protein CCAND93_630008 [Capnocytophaga canis]